MAIRLLAFVIVGAISGCAALHPVPGFIDCPGPTDNATSRAAACMTAVLYDTALKKVEASRDSGTTDEDENSGEDEERGQGKEADGRSKERTP